MKNSNPSNRLYRICESGERTSLLLPIFIIQMKMEVLRPLELDFDSYDVTLVCEDEQEEGGGAQLCGRVPRHLGFER